MYSMSRRGIIFSFVWDIFIKCKSNIHCTRVSRFGLQQLKEHQALELLNAALGPSEHSGFIRRQLLAEVMNTENTESEPNSWRNQINKLSDTQNSLGEKYSLISRQIHSQFDQLQIFVWQRPLYNMFYFTWRLSNSAETDFTAMSM